MGMKKVLILCIILIFPFIPVFGQKAYKIGDLYEQGQTRGIVYYVDRSGQHGKIVSIDEFFGNWCSKEYQEVLIGATDNRDGLKNIGVIQSIPNWREKFSLFSQCVNLGRGWYVPSKEELIQVGKQFKKINYTLSMYGYKLLTGNYYSSTEVNENSVWNVWMNGNGSSMECYEVYKDSRVGGVCKFRAIRSF